MRNIDEIVLALDKEVMMVRDIGVEVGLGAVDRHFPQQPGICELVKGVVNRGQRNCDLGTIGLFIEHFRREVPIALCKQEPAQCYALASRTQPHLAQKRQNVVPRTPITALDRSVARGRMPCRGMIECYLGTKLHGSRHASWEMPSDDCFTRNYIHCLDLLQALRNNLHPAYILLWRASTCSDDSVRPSFAQWVAYVREMQPCKSAYTAARTKSECKNDVRALNSRTCSPAAAAKCLLVVRNCRCHPC